MTIHNQAQRERVDVDLSFEWDSLPPSFEQVAQIPLEAAEVRFRRVGNTHRGISRLSRIKRLWAYAVDQDFLDEICDLKNLELLYLEKVTASDLARVNALPHLRSLSVIGAPKIEDLSWVPKQPTLRSLAIENVKAVHDLAPLSQLAQLRALGVEGSMWTSMQVSSLAPLSALRLLECLFMTNLRAKDQSLQALHGLAQLRVLQCAQFFPQEEFRRLAKVRPRLRCDWFDDQRWKRAT